MVLADFNILIVGCNEIPDLASSENESLCFDYQKLPLKREDTLYDVWKIYSKIKGVNCQIYSKLRKDCKFDEELFDMVSTKRSSKVEVLRSFDTLKKLLETAIEFSPMKRIVVLFRLEGDKKEKYSSCQKLSEFLIKLKENHILYNTAYILSNG